MQRELLHTPEGVRDIYEEEYEKKLILQDRLNEQLRRYGYHPIQTPMFEFFDIFGREIGTTPSRDLYKFFDKEGNTLVLRPDLTPSVARCVATYFGGEDLPVRLSYMGNTFINNSRYQGRLKETTQLGAELVGDPSVDADAEIISLVVACLKAAGLKEFQISIGHAGFFRGLTDAAGLSVEQEEELRDLLSNKNFFGVEEFVETLQLKDDLRQLFSMPGRLYGSAAEWEEMKRHAADYPQILSSLLKLELLMSLLGAYDVARYVSFEPGMISSYHYYTGIVFAGYTYGSGEPIVKGGRYDRLLSYFGRDAAALGFAFVVDQLLAALARQQIAIPVTHRTHLFVYRASRRADAITKARRMREYGHHVELLLWDDTKTKENYMDYARRHHITELEFIS